MNQFVPPSVITVSTAGCHSSYNPDAGEELLKGAKSSRRVRCGLVLAALIAGSAGAASAQPPVLADLHGFGPRQLKSQSFVLEAAQDVHIEAAGAESTSVGKKVSALASMWQHDGNVEPSWSGNAWILDLQSRKVVWELSASTTTRGAKGSREFKGIAHLPAGSYTAYYASFPDGDYWTDENAKSNSQPKWHWFGDEPVQDF